MFPYRLSGTVRMMSELVDINLTEQMAFSWPNKEIEGWNHFRVEYGGCNEDCYYEGSIWLPPEANIDHKLFEILQVPEARQELHESIERIHKEKVGKLSNWRTDDDTGKS
jgi:hypothetical protein